jgi:hypothetical protein
VANQFRVELDIQPFVDTLTEGGVEAAKRAVEEALEGVEGIARAGWPVGNPSEGSRDAFVISIEDSPVRIGGQLSNVSGYAPFINSGRTVQRLMVEPTQREGMRLPRVFLALLGEI